MQEFDVCVIGAGFGGASVAALLAKSGKKVALVEKTARAGGKTQTTERKGYRFEMFGAVGIPAYNSRFHELVDTLGIAERAPFPVLHFLEWTMHELREGFDWEIVESLSDGDEARAYE